MKILVVDKNKELIKMVQDAISHLPYTNISVKVGDIFAEEGVIVSASNPYFSCSGGLDFAIAARGHTPPKEPGRHGSIIWAITVDENIVSSRELVHDALDFACSLVNPDETLLVSGLGTGIGGLSYQDFISALLEIIDKINSLEK